MVPSDTPPSSSQESQAQILRQRRLSLCRMLRPRHHLRGSGGLRYRLVTLDEVVDFTDGLIVRVTMSFLNAAESASGLLMRD